jgi:hypothetical protein
MKQREIEQRLDPDRKHPTWEEHRTQEEPLKGLYFHTIKEGILKWQGLIRGQYGENVLIITYEWIGGYPSVMYLIKISDLTWNEDTQTGYYLYADRDAFMDSIEHGMAYSAQKRNRGKKGKDPKRNAK